MTALSERAMLARLNIRQWSARKLDRKVTDEVNTAHNASPDAGRYNKRLVSKDALATIQKVANEARKMHYARTLPWQDEGARILSTAGYLDYTGKVRDLRAEFESAVDAFVSGYPDFVTDARSKLNGLFQETDYPPADDIRSRFAFSVAIDPMPVSDDFRCQLDAAQAEEIRADIEARTRDAITAATRDVWTRISLVVGHMAEKLKEYKPAVGPGARAEGVFRDSLVENVRDLVAVLPSLNITGDPALAAIADRMQSLCRDDAAELRDNASARASVAAEADAILADVGQFLA